MFIHRLLLVLGVAVMLQAPPAFSQSHKDKAADNVAAPERAGIFSGGIRSFVMSTTNRGSLKDWWSWALGGNLGYQSPRLYGISLGARGYVTTQALGNALSLDQNTGRASRYEWGLYDLGAQKRTETALLGQAYLDLDAGGHHLWLGRRSLKSPLVNPQDGRMIPTLVQGAWYENTQLTWLKAQLGYLSHIAPRGGSTFLRIEDSIGLYPVGRSTSGAPSDYKNHLSSQGLTIFALSHSSKHFDANVYNYAALGLFNALYVDASYKGQLAGAAVQLAGQAIWERRLADGGSSHAEQRYFEDKQAQVYGVRAELRPETSWTLSLSYNRITAHGRFLFPREWGREPLYTFQKRERSEGAGDQHAIAASVRKKMPLFGGHLTGTLSQGAYLRPDARSFALNKYALPSLYQWNAELNYQAGGALDGVSADFLVAYKVALDDVRDNAALVQNKVDMINWNFVVEYSF